MFYFYDYIKVYRKKIKIMKNIYIKTWGCQMNEHDSSMIVNILQQSNNYKCIETDQDANILILNTCSIREKAQEKLFHQLGRWKKLKEKNPDLIIAVGGCVATQEGKNIFKRANYIDIIFGTQTLHRLPNLIKKAEKSKKLTIDISFSGIEKYKNIKKISSSKNSSFVSIMEGCSKYCSFCIVPYTRGKEINRPVKDILFEIESLAKKGTKEVILLGQNVNSYLIKKSHNKKPCNFAKLLRLISFIDEIKRIRFITSHPISFDDEIIQVYQDIPKLVNFLHLPVQSGSDRILKLMKRNYNVTQYKKIIQNLKQVRPNIQISSDFIIGFPGETELDFQKTIELIYEINFDMSYSFIYSSRPGTPASKLLDNTPLQAKKNRLHKVQKIINQQTISWSRKMLGTKQLVLVNGPSKKNIMELSGKTENNRTVNFPGNPNMIGNLVEVDITEVYYHSLKGKLSL